MCLYIGGLKTSESLVALEPKDCYEADGEDAADHDEYIKVSCSTRARGLR